jgi:hypothetical protein
VALEEAGVSLQAEGFTDYIKKLDRIDKAQQEIFNVTSQKTGKSYAEVTAAAKKYETELKRVAAAEKKAQDEAKKLAVAQKTAAATQQQAFISAGSAVLDFAQKIGTLAIESGKLGAQFQGQQIGLKNLAAASGQSGAQIQAAIQTASKGTISGLDAIQAANQALLFGVAKTPEEFATLTNSALTLGRTLGLTGTQSIEQFTTALGRQSLLILDNFGISAKQVNAEIERLAQADFGVAKAQLTEAQKQATFMKAALKIAGEAAAVIGDEAGAAQASFDRLTASTENLKVTFGVLAGPLGGGISDALSRAAKTAQQFLAFLGAGITGFGTIVQGVFKQVSDSIVGTISRGKQLLAGDIGLKDFLFEPSAEIKTFGQILDEAGVAAIDRFKEIAATVEGVSFDDTGAEQLSQDLGDVGDGAEEAAQGLEAYQAAIKQAEQLQLSFARAAEDTAIKLARANEDIARKQAKSVADLEGKQAKDRDKLLKNQQKQLDRFEKDREKQIAKAESDIAKARKEADDKRKADQKKLQRELQRAQESFNLSRLQSERRFALSESRLRAEGDILGLKELREDRALERKEEKENFDLSKKDQVQSAKKELKSNLEDRRAELLKSFDEQFNVQQQAQAEARAEQQRGFEEAAAERQIQLAREEEDRRLSQARQLEDLGRSLAEQQGVTEEGANAIAGELEKVFGQEGVADSIFTGFKERTESDFRDLFENIGETVSEAKPPEPPKIPVELVPQVGGGGFGGRIGGVQEFGTGGVVGGPIGSPQIIQAHGGETVLPTHTQSFQMAAPVIPSQSLDVNMSGGFSVSGDGQGDEAIMKAAAAEMTENFRIAVRRIARKN